MAKLHRRMLSFVGALALCACAAALATPSAKAGLLGCGTGSHPFAAVDGDTDAYFPMENGGFEAGSNGWTLSEGASVVSGNEPWSVQGGSHALSLPSGSSAAGPNTCLALLSPTLRMFANDQGGTDNGLLVTVEYRSLLGALLGIRTYTVLGAGNYQGWQPTDRVSIPLGILGGVPLATASFRVRLTPLGAGSAWRIDDVFVDPWICGTA